MDELRDLTIDELRDQVAELASHIYAGTCRWLRLVGELDARGSFADSGTGSCAEWLAWRCALSQRAAREHVRVARRLRELPLTEAAFARGELSYAKVRALTRVADSESEEELLGLAYALTAAQLDRVVCAYRRVSAAEANKLHELAYVTYYWDDDGCFCFQGRLAPEDGVLFLRGLEAGRDALREAWDANAEERVQRQLRGPAGPAHPLYRPKNADALVAMADAALSGGAHSGGERYQVVVHADAGSLADDEAGGCTLEDGAAVSAETARRLACDASVVRMHERKGESLSVGRKTRSVPPSLRRALRTRDGRCRFPGCENRRFVDAHHIRHWARGGETAIDNLVLLCRRHHRLVHEGGYSVEALANGELEFRYPWGGPFPGVPRPPPGDAERLLHGNRPLAIDPYTCAGGEGDPMDLDMAVDALAGILA
jgi:Domain of unknown function (DUF222)/HNH endonuclease